MLDSSKAKFLLAIEEIQYASSKDEVQEKVDSVCMELGSFQDTARVNILEGKPSDLFVELCVQRIREAQIIAMRRIFDYNDNISVSANAEKEEGAKPSVPLEEDQHLTKSKDITQTLRRIHQMAQGEVLRSELNVQELDVGSSGLVELQQRYSVVDVLLNGSRQLVKVLDEADAWDRRKMQFALSFLAACLAWVLWRRVFGPPIRFLIWSFLKLIGVVKYGASWAPEFPQNALKSTADTLLATSAASVTVSSHETESFFSTSTATLPNEAHVDL